MFNINKFRKILENKHILIGVSGGPDSMCLLYLLNGLKKEWNLKLSAAHVNYCLRGKDSEKDEKLAEKICKDLQIDFYSLKLKKEQIIKKDENSLRDIRYDFFKKIKENSGADYIAAAHNSDDQAETVLMRFIRGSSAKGLGGMEYLSGKLIRPLLDISREEILKYLKENKIEYRTDKTNLGEKYLRSKIRNKLIPLLEKEYNPNIKQTLGRNSQILKNINDFIYNYSSLVFGSISKIENKIIKIDYKKWLLLQEAVRMEVLKIAIKKIAGSLKDVEFAHLNEIISMLENKIPIGEKKIIKHLSIKEKYDTIEITRIT